MSYAGIHVTCSDASSARSNGALPVDPDWSADGAVTGAGASSTPVPGRSNEVFRAITVTVSADFYYAVGSTAAAAQANAQGTGTGPRMLILASQLEKQFYTAPGNYVGWSAA